VFVEEGIIHAAVDAGYLRPVDVARHGFGWIPLRYHNGNQYLHRKSADYRARVKRKMRAYHAFIQAGVVAQGLLQYLAVVAPRLVWDSFGSWLRTINQCGASRSSTRCACASSNRRARRRDENNDPRALADIVSRATDFALRAGANPAPRQVTGGARRPGHPTIPVNPHRVVHQADLTI
jgi:hypothetical protein